MTKYHELTEKIASEFNWGDSAKRVVHKVVINWLEERVKLWKEMEARYEGHFNREEYLRSYLGITPPDPKKELEERLKEKFTCGISVLHYDVVVEECFKFMEERK